MIRRDSTPAHRRGSRDRPVASSAELQLLFFGRRVEDVVAVDQEGLTIGQGETGVASFALDRLDSHELAATRHAM